MIRQNCKGDFHIAESFYDNLDGGNIQIKVPDHVRIEYFTKNTTDRMFIVERNRTEYTNCQLSDDGMNLIANISLSRQFIGTGEMYHRVIVFVEDDAFHGGFRQIPIPGVTEVMLWNGESENGINIISESILSAFLYGFSAYQLALKHGYQGTEEEYAMAPVLAMEMTDKYVELVETVNNIKYSTEESIYTGPLVKGRGILVQTNIAMTYNAMIYGEIRGHTNSDSLTVFTAFQFYNYVSSNTIIAQNACNYGASFGAISAFGYNGSIYIWFPYNSDHQSFSVFVRVGNAADDVNHVAAITTSVIPVGITRRVDITPVEIIRKGQAAGGALTGTYPNPDIGSGAVTNDNLAGGITGIKLANNTISADKAARHLVGSVFKLISTIRTNQYYNLVDLFAYDEIIGKFTSGAFRIGAAYNTYYINCNMDADQSIYWQSASMLIMNDDKVNKSVRFTTAVYGNHYISVAPGEQVVVSFMPSENSGFIITSVLKYDRR